MKPYIFSLAFVLICIITNAQTDNNFENVYITVLVDGELSSCDLCYLKNGEWIKAKEEVSPCNGHLIICKSDYDIILQTDTVMILSSCFMNYGKYGYSKYLMIYLSGKRLDFKKPVIPTLVGTKVPNGNIIIDIHTSCKKENRRKYNLSKDEDDMYVTILQNGISKMVRTDKSMFIYNSDLKNY